MGSQIRRQGPLLSALPFKAFLYFQCFRILANVANFCKTLLDKFHVRQVYSRLVVLANMAVRAKKWHNTPSLFVFKYGT